MTAKDARELVAERFGLDIVPLELDDARAAFVAAMQSLIAWFVRHPNVPAPWSINIGVRVPDVETLERLAVELDKAPWPRDGAPQQITLFDPVETPLYAPIAISVDDEPGRPL